MQFGIDIDVKRTVSEKDSCQLIQELQPPVPPEQERHVIAVIALEGNAVEHASRAADARGHATAIQRRALASVVTGEAGQKLVAAEEAEKDAVEASLVQAIIFSFCSFVCLGAEFTLTLVTLPFLLNIEQWSFLGFVLALAPTTAMIVLDRVLHRLLEDPWQRIRRVVHTAGQRIAVTAIMAVFLLGLGAGNLFTVFLLADARERATEIRLAAETTTGAEENDSVAPERLAEHRAIVRKAVIAVSVFVTLDGALFCLLALSEIRAFSHARRLRQLVARCRAALDAARATLGQTEVQVAEADFDLGLSADRARTNADRFREERMAELASAKRWPKANGNGPDLVNTILTSSVGASFGPRPN